MREEPRIHEAQVREELRLVQRGGGGQPGAQSQTSPRSPSSDFLRPFCLERRLMSSSTLPRRRPSSRFPRGSRETPSSSPRRRATSGSWRAPVSLAKGPEMHLPRTPGCEITSFLLDQGPLRRRLTLLPPLFLPYHCMSAPAGPRAEDRRVRPRGRDPRGLRRLPLLPQREAAGARGDRQLRRARAALRPAAGAQRPPRTSAPAAPTAARGSEKRRPAESRRRRPRDGRARCRLRTLNRSRRSRRPRPAAGSRA